jgi:hypothetical protein
MHCEQFISSLSEIIAASPNIETALTLDELRFLAQLGNGIKQPQCLRTIINNQYGAVSYIEPIEDNDHRKGVWNHTIIINLKEYFNATMPTKFLADKFLLYTKNPPRKLQTIVMEQNVSPNPAT